MDIQIIMLTFLILWDLWESWGRRKKVNALEERVWLTELRLNELDRTQLMLYKEVFDDSTEDVTTGS